MTKIEIEAIRALPEVYVRDATEVALVRGVPCALNPALLPMLYLGGKWEPLDTSHGQACEIVAETVTPDHLRTVMELAGTTSMDSQQFYDALDAVAAELRARRAKTDCQLDRVPPT